MSGGNNKNSNDTFSAAKTVWNLITPSLSFNKHVTWGSTPKKKQIFSPSQARRESRKITNKNIHRHFLKVTFSPIQTLDAWDIPQNDLLSNIDQRIGPVSGQIFCGSFLGR